MHNEWKVRDGGRNQKEGQWDLKTCRTRARSAQGCDCLPMTRMNERLSNALMMVRIALKKVFGVF
jgi:hypothetical protein